MKDKETPEQKSQRIERQISEFKLNEWQLKQISEIESVGYEALKRTETKEELYIRRCLSDPDIYGDMIPRRAYLREIRARMQKFEKI